MRVRLCGSLLWAAGGLMAAPLSAHIPPAAENPSNTPSDAAPTLPANAVIELEMVDTVASETSKPGDFFHMRVTVPVAWRDQLLVPAGTVAVGQVVHAQKAGGGGKGGELILAARYLELAQGQVKLRSTFGAAGANRVRSSLALSYAVGPFALFVRGKNVSMPAGSALSARVATETAITPAPATTDATSATPEPRSSTQ